MMPTVDQKFIFDGSRLSRNYQDARRSNATVLCSVSGVADTNEAKTAAINAAVADVGTTYPHEHGPLPLLEASADVWASGTVWVRLVYAHSNASNPTQSPWDMARIRYFGKRRAPGFVRITTDGSGGTNSETITAVGNYQYRLQSSNYDVTEGDRPASEPDEALFIIPQNRWVPVFQIEVPAGLLTTNPLDTIEDLMGAFNSDSVTIMGRDFTVGQLECIGWQSDSVDANDTIKHPGFYVFHYSPGGFNRIEFRDVVYAEPLQDDVFNRIVNRFAVSVTIRPPDRNEAFADAFPTFEGVGPPAASE